jgi:hypothetical protein
MPNMPNFQGFSVFDRFSVFSQVVRKKEVYGSLVDLSEFKLLKALCVRTSGVPVNRAALILEQKSGAHIFVCRNRNSRELRPPLARRHQMELGGRLERW